MKLKKTTLLVIGAVLLWGSVALWNGIQREHSGASLTRTEYVGRVNIATH
ncbi:hypothetical protein [Paenibacillus eucommiae]|uniref:Uncharacterized protein n=1 Tax=Paenibacillus eucommiae TaxID=1355755 RepID=A0ABS4JA94_9BACL|nr:hypothetical protein [Paenibacillus eucommiae]MBP1996774.1 hypothetical protein [Paenibacillus eucommiae]